jgi:YVTN family beta-propeller protein
LLVPGEDVRVEMPVSVERRRATTVWLTLDGTRSVPGGVSFSPAFSAAPPPLLVPGLVAYVSSPAAGNVTVLDRRTRQVMSVIFTGGEPRGIALAMIRLQAFIALGSDDVIQVQDLAGGAALSRIRLRPGDRPRDVALTPDGSVLVVVNEGSSTVSFVDPAAQVELDRVPTGQQPEFLLLDRAGRRGYVCNRASGSVTVLDVANRAVAGTIQTEAAPVALGLSRAGDRLYVAHAASPYLNVYSTATLAPVNRVLVGMGASALVVDPRTDLIYLGRNGASQIDVLEPNLLLPVGIVPVPDWVSFAILDETENVLLATMPSRDGVVAVDLTSRKVAGVAAAAGSPFRIAGAGERR